MTAEAIDEATITHAMRIAENTARRFPIGGDMRSRLDTEDLISEAYVGAWEALLGYDPARGCSWQAWVITKCRGRILEAMRQADFLTRHDRRKVRKNPEAEAPVRLVPYLWHTEDEEKIFEAKGQPDFYVEATPARVDAARFWDRARPLLSSKQRHAVRLLVFAGLSQKETARELSVCESRVNQLWQEAKRTLKKAWEEGENGSRLQAPRSTLEQSPSSPLVEPGAWSLERRCAFCSGAMDGVPARRVTCSAACHREHQKRAWADYRERVRLKEKEPPKEKVCCSCREKLAKDAFHANRAALDGLQKQCKRCRAEHARRPDQAETNCLRKRVWHLLEGARRQRERYRTDTAFKARMLAANRARYQAGKADARRQTPDASVEQEPFPLASGDRRLASGSEAP